MHPAPIIAQTTPGRGLDARCRAAAATATAATGMGHGAATPAPIRPRAGRYRQRDGDAERPAGKLIPDRHRAAPYGRPGEHQRRPAQHVIHIRPDSSSAGRGELDDRPLLGRHASKANGQRRPSAESNQSLAAHPAPSTSPAAITGGRGALRPARGHSEATTDSAVWISCRPGGNNEVAFEFADRLAGPVHQARRPESRLATGLVRTEPV